MRVLNPELQVSGEPDNKLDLAGLLNIFIYDHITGGGVGGQVIPEPLMRRSENVVRALVSDFLRMPGIQLCLWRDQRLPELPYSGFDDLRVQQLKVEQFDRQRWQAQVEAVDAVWIIAPETGGVLESLSTSVLRIGKTLLGSSPKAVSLCASKLACANVLRTVGIDVAETAAVDRVVDWDFPCVLKPDDGMGGNDIWRFPDSRTAVEFHARRSFTRPMIIQQFIEGDVGSISMLCNQGRATVLSINALQTGTQDGRIFYKSTNVGGFSTRTPRFMQMLKAMAEMVAAAIPGLWGFVSIDFVMSAQGPRIIEVNPRLTDAFVGLFEARGINLAEMAMELAPVRSKLSTHTPIQPWATSRVEQPAVN